MNSGNYSDSCLLKDPVHIRMMYHVAYIVYVYIHALYTYSRRAVRESIATAAAAASAASAASACVPHDNFINSSPSLLLALLVASCEPFLDQGFLPTESGKVCHRERREILPAARGASRESYGDAQADRARFRLSLTSKSNRDFASAISFIETSVRSKRACVRVCIGKKITRFTNMRGKKRNARESRGW